MPTRKPYSIPLKNLGCCSTNVRAFAEKYYPGKKTIPVTEENFYLFFLMYPDDIPAIAMDLVKRVPGATYSNGLYPSGAYVEGEAFDAYQDNHSKQNLLILISALQSQGVFR